MLLRVRFHNNNNNNISNRRWLCQRVKVISEIWQKMFERI